MTKQFLEQFHWHCLSHRALYIKKKNNPIQLNTELQIPPFNEINIHLKNMQGIYEWRQCCFHLTDLEDIHSYWKEAKYGKTVRKDGYSMEFLERTRQEEE
jgi:hypothetical protein